MKTEKLYGRYRRFFPAFFLLGVAVLLVLLPVAVFLSGPYLIPAFVFSGAGALFLFFRCERAFLNSLSLTPVPPGDPWRLGFFLKKSEPSFPVTLHLIKTPVPLSFCFGGCSSFRIVFSEKLLEMLSEEERELMVFWYVRAGERGRIFFLTLLSAILRGLDGFFSLVSLPHRLLFRKKRKMNFVFRLILHGLRWFLRGVFFRMDKVTAKGRNPRKLALTLWKMQSLYETETCPLPFFFAPLFFADPLSAEDGPAVPLQPDKRQRVRSLMGAYPP